MGDKYLSIGKVAKLKNISIKALRYYDEIGILPPAYINPETNYRYYTNEQLPMLDAIHLCLQLGIPLKTLPSYVYEEQFDFSALLSDTRNLAEEKIHGIRMALDRIEGACLSAAAYDSAKPAVSIPRDAARGTSQPVIFSQDEYLIGLPLSEDLLPPFDGFVLKLFIYARQKNITIENPSCILYRYENSCFKKYLCLKFIPTPETSPNDAAAGLSGSEFRFFKIPADTYTRRLQKKNIDFPSANSISIFGAFSDETAHSLLERRLTDTGADNTEYSFELIELNTTALT